MDFVKVLHPHDTELHYSHDCQTIFGEDLLLSFRPQHIPSTHHVLIMTLYIPTKENVNTENGNTTSSLIAYYIQVHHKCDQ